MARKHQSFIVLVSSEYAQRAFGPFRSFKAADGNAKAWGGAVIPLETTDAPSPWDVNGYVPAPG